MQLKVYQFRVRSLQEFLQFATLRGKRLKNCRIASQHTSSNIKRKIFQEKCLSQHELSSTSSNTEPGALPCRSPCSWIGCTKGVYERVMTVTIQNLIKKWSINSSFKPQAMLLSTQKEVCFAFVLQKSSDNNHPNALQAVENLEDQKKPRTADQPHGWLYICPKTTVTTITKGFILRVDHNTLTTWPHQKRPANA